MNLKLVVTWMVSGVGVSLCGAPADRAILAAMRLSEQPGYSWTTSVVDDARSYTIEGKTEQGRCTWVRLPMVESVAQRLGRQADVEIEAFFRGNTMAVIRTERGWQTLDELPRRHWDSRGDIQLWPTRPPAHMRALQATGRVSADPGAGLDLADGLEPPPPVSIPRTAFPHADDERPYSNAQFAVGHPHDELAVIVSSFAEMNVETDVVTGALTPVGAALLLVRDGQEHLQPLGAAGTFKLSLQNGIVTRYTLRLEGILLVEKKQIRVRQTSSTLISKIGATRVNVPDEAKRKLGVR